MCIPSFFLLVFTVLTYFSSSPSLSFSVTFLPSALLVFTPMFYSSGPFPGLESPTQHLSPARRRQFPGCPNIMLFRVSLSSASRRSFPPKKKKNHVVDFVSVRTTRKKKKSQFFAIFSSLSTLIQHSPILFPILFPIPSTIKFLNGQNHSSLCHSPPPPLVTSH